MPPRALRRAQVWANAGKAVFVSGSGEVWGHICAHATCRFGGTLGQLLSGVFGLSAMLEHISDFRSYEVFL